MGNQSGRAIQINLYSHFVQSWHILIHATVIFIFPLYFKIQYGDDSLQFAYKAALIAFGIVFVPHTFLHIRYWIVNKGMEITFSKGGFLIKFKGRQLNIAYNEIEKVEVVESKASANKSLQWFPWDGYSYAKIKTKNGEVIVVTSLLLPHLDFPVKLPRVNFISSYFCWL